MRPVSISKKGNIMKQKRVILRLFFSTEKHGQVEVRRHVHANITPDEVYAIADKLIPAYRTKKGVRLKALLRGNIIQNVQDAIKL